ncbi:MAG: hypothetical protein LBN74_03005 [Prevotella sp.]|jgi:hypothetical protein|nr:hypothetical protein [Prevotella sp.]
MIEITTDSGGITFILGNGDERVYPKNYFRYKKGDRIIKFCPIICEDGCPIEVSSSASQRRPMKWALKRFSFLLRLWAKGRQAICDCAR